MKPRDALIKYVENHGPVDHDSGCPQDDTCSCSAKPIHDGVEQAIKELEQNAQLRAALEVAEGALEAAVDVIGRGFVTHVKAITRREAKCIAESALAAIRAAKEKP